MWLSFYPVKEIFSFLKYLFIWLHRVLVAACGLLAAVCELLVAACMWELVPWPGIKPRPPALGAQQSLNHWTIREVPRKVSVCLQSINSQQIFVLKTQNQSAHVVKQILQAGYRKCSNYNCFFKTQIFWFRYNITTFASLQENITLWERQISKNGENGS